MRVQFLRNSFRKGPWNGRSQRAIEWTDATWNPWIGCSVGCPYCYAKRENERFRWVSDWAQPRRTKNWNKPLSWDKKAAREGRRVKVMPSLCDFFDPVAPEEWRQEAFVIMCEARHLDWLILTKCQNQMRDWRKAWSLTWPANVCLVVSVTSQADAFRIKALDGLEVPARIVSAEPLRGALDLQAMTLDDGRPALEAIDWVIVGGESGPRHAPMELEWARLLRDQCKEANKAFFFKQTAGKGKIPEDLMVREFPSALSDRQRDDL